MDDTEPPIINQPFNDFQVLKEVPMIAGLETLDYLNEVSIHQRYPSCLEAMGFVCGDIESRNKYDVLDGHGNHIYYMQEESSCLARSFLKNARPIEISFQNNESEILRFQRPFRCQECCCGFNQELTVMHQGQMIGMVKENPRICGPKHLEIWDETNEKVFDIHGPCLVINCGAEIIFTIDNKAGVTVGQISRKVRGLMTELMTDVNSFCIEFPFNISASMKAIIIGANMLIEYMYFESKG